MKITYIESPEGLAHDLGVDALKRLGLPLVLSSRPVPSANILANEAFALIDGNYHFAHQKHYFPEEPGFYETAWFRTAQKGFERRKTAAAMAAIVSGCYVVSSNRVGKTGTELVFGGTSSGASNNR